MTHPNIELMRRYSETLTAGQAAEILPYFTEDCVLHIPGRSPHAGNYEGQDAVLAYYTRIFQDTGRQFEHLGIDDGKIVEIWVRDWDQYAYDELFADVAPTG